MKHTPFLLTCALALPLAVRAELKLPSVISDHMVLQQKQSDPIWGWDAPGTKVTVTFAGQTKTAEADSSGKWTVKLDPMPANAKSQSMTIKGTDTKELQDILIGEVWMCSGQSNMGFSLGQDWNGDLECLASHHPDLRLFKLPLVGTQELKTDINAQWQETTPQNTPAFTAVGFMFGRYLHEILGVPVGLIENAWGGSSAEAWVRRSTLEGDPRFKDLIAQWKNTEATYDPAKIKAAYEAAVAKWKEGVSAAKAAGKPAPPAPRPPQDAMAGQHRPGNIFAGMMYPTLGYAIKGVVWYQGESNAGRAWEYRSLFPFMIEQWRKEWKQGDFPFYWVQLADFKAEQPNPGDSDWAELREAQTLSMKLPNTGQCVITDLGEGKDIHPKNKHDVAARLVRWALVKDYGMKLPYHSPEFKSMEIKGNKAIVTLDMFGSALRPFDVKEAVGFAVCGADKVWHWATGTVIGGDKVEVSSDKVPQPVAVRYAWADNPVCNLFSNDGLPLTPFRTDDFEMITKPKPVAAKPAPAPAKPKTEAPKPNAEAKPAAKKAA
jgi:sialate O-acetylesterase